MQTDSRSPFNGSDTALSFNVHHVGVAVRDIRKTASSYVESWGYKVETDVIHDPQQQAYVQFLRFPGDQVYLELVEPEGPAAPLSRAVEKGGGVNHVCYSTDDIEAACEGLRKRGFFLVKAPVPATAFNGRRIAWVMGRDRLVTELVERGRADEL
ncbi:MAG: VOC family protein [Bryobacteraceae bacterium]